MRLDVTALKEHSSCCQFYKDTMSVVYAVEGSSILPHPQLEYATDETLLTHTFCYGPSFYCVYGFIARVLKTSVAISTT